MSNPLNRNKIKEFYNNTGCSVRDLAKKFNVNRSIASGLIDEVLQDRKNGFKPPEKTMARNIEPPARSKINPYVYAGLSNFKLVTPAQWFYLKMEAKNKI